MFELNLQTVVKGRECSHVDICGTQLSFHLLVPLYKKKGNLYTVASGLKKMLKKSEPFRSGELPCRNCDKTKALKRETIKYLVVSKVPEILILQIGRTENTETYNSLRKRNILVRYQHTLKIDEVEWEVDGSKKAVQHSYKLYGVVLHSGNIDCGHYYCYVMHRITLKWFKCNDSLVTPIEEKNVLNSPNAYLLFYEKNP
ncbi:ubiquitin carboxyl-terminal hydrolase 2-like isoform X1 [Mytilus galloprovincialis]|uniref:ubiquitin carboxyl-terminal hydrolase 2-like isoform X1 n=1 Tax=Mytilus galloprovincialis TaxID=29158 RepID=UPI003F7BC525